MWLSLFLALLLGSQNVPATATSWGWFHASSAANRWSIDQGQADVTTAGKQFKATLWDGDERKFARLSLEGTITGTAVEAKVTLNNSDQRPFLVAGRLTRTCDEGRGRESIILSTGFDVIGFVREIRGSCHNIP